MACRIFLKPYCILKQFLFCQKNVKARIYTFFTQFAKNWQNRDEMTIRRNLRIFFFKDRSNFCSFSCFWKHTLLKWKIDYNCWGLLWTVKMNFWNFNRNTFSISDSWKGLIKNEFLALSLKYELKDLFFRCKIWTDINKKTTECLSDVILFCNNIFIYN